MLIEGFDVLDYDLNDSASINSTTSSHLHRSVMMSGALPNRSTTSVSRQHRNHIGEQSKRVRSPTRTLRMPRDIQPQHQNWLARFLRINPAVTSFCFQTSRVRARKEITAMLREWRKYGMKDVVVDKAAGRIWARVAVKNCKNRMIFYPLHI